MKNLSVILSLLLVIVFSCDPAEDEYQDSQEDNKTVIDSTPDISGSWLLTSKPSEKHSYKWVIEDSLFHVLSTDLEAPLDGKFDTCGTGHYDTRWPNKYISFYAGSEFCNYMTYYGDWLLVEHTDSSLTLHFEQDSLNVIVYTFEKE